MSLWPFLRRLASKATSGPVVAYEGLCSAQTLGLESVGQLHGLESNAARGLQSAGDSILGLTSTAKRGLLS